MNHDVKIHNFYYKILKKWTKVGMLPFMNFPKNAEFSIISFVLYRNGHLVVTLLNKWNTNYKWHLYDHNHSFLAARNIFFSERNLHFCRWHEKKNEACRTHHYSCEAISSLVEAAKTWRAATDQQMGNEQEYKFPANWIINICCLHPGNTVNQKCHDISRQNIISNWD